MFSTLTVVRPSLAFFLAALLAFPNGVRAQQPNQTPPPSTAGAAPTTAGAVPTQPLKVFVLEGADAVNSIPNRTVTFPVVEIRDENDIPVEGAVVVFELPPSGPGGSFPNQQSTFTTRANLQGQARAPFIINTTPGAFDIKVTATAGSRTGNAMIRQTNSMRVPEEVAAKKRPWYKSWKLMAIAGGAATAAVIVLLARRGDSGTVSAPTITITPGTPTFGGPR